MRLLASILTAAALLGGDPVHAQRAPGLDENVGQIPQSAPGSPWSFIGFGILTPSSPQWFVTVSTPRSGAMGRSLSTNAAHGAVLVISSELLEQPIEAD